MSLRATAKRSPSRFAAALALAAGLLLQGLAALAQPNPQAGTQQRAPVELTIAGQKQGFVIAVLDNGDVWLPQATLDGAGLHLPSHLTRQIDGQPYVSLRSLEPHVRFKYDPQTISVDLAVLDPAVLAGEADRYDLASAPARSKAPHVVTSGFVNYQISDSFGAGSAAASGYTEAGFGNSAGRFDATAAVQQGSFERGLVNYTIDRPAKMMRIVVGDELSETISLFQTAVVYGGLNVSRDFAMQPNLIIRPTAQFSGTALAPAQADIYVNGQLYRTVQLDPGPFQFDNLNLPPGANVTRIVLRDVYGNVTQYGGATYVAQTLLRKGITDYDYHLGFPRLDPFGPQDTYSPLAASGGYRIGLTDEVTAGGALQATKGLVAGGPTVSAALPFGQVDLATSFSDSAGAIGHAINVGYSYLARRFSATAFYGARTPSYATIGTPANATPQPAGSPSTPIPAYGLSGPSNSVVLNTNGESATYNISNSASVMLEHSSQFYESAPPTDRLAASLRFASFGRSQVTFTVERDVGSILGTTTTAPTGHTLIFGLQWTYRPHPNEQIQTTASAGNGATNSVSLTRSANDEPGALTYDGTVSNGGGAPASLAADAEYFTQSGNISAALNGGGGQTSGSATVAGAVAFFKQGAFFTRPIEGAYGLVQVDGTSHVNVAVDGLNEGSTGRRGALVVPQIGAYTTNAVDVPSLASRPDLQVGGGPYELVTREGSADAVKIDVRRLQFVVGTLVVQAPDSTFAPSYGTITLTSPGGEYSSPIAENGGFFFESLPSGAYKALITYGPTGSCAFSVSVPVSADMKIDLGSLTCSK